MGIKIIVADDNKDFNLSFTKYLTKDKDLEVIDMTLTGKETIHSYISNAPDVLILDLNLPNSNGIEVLKTLCKYDSYCNILIVSGSYKLRNKLSDISKVYKIFTKPCSFEEIVTTIKEMHLISKIDIEKQIKNLLNKLNFNMQSIGTKYLIDAIITANSHSSLYKMDQIYRIVSIKYNVNQNIVKWGINNSLATMNRFSNQNLIYNTFVQYDGRKISAKYFLYLMLEYINNKW